MAAVKRPLEQRMSKWNKNTGLGLIREDGTFSPCWIWTGAISGRSGYGNIEIDGHAHATHRVSYALHNGGIPEGMVLDHLCKNRACGNPDHLEPVTQRENVRRGDSPVGALMRARGIR